MFQKYIVVLLNGSLLLHLGNEDSSPDLVSHTQVYPCY